MTAGRAPRHPFGQGLSIAFPWVHNDLVGAPSSRADELAALRRRAYGPDADIQADPRALARLEELEQESSPFAHGEQDQTRAPSDRRPPRDGAGHMAPAAEPARVARWSGVAGIIAVVASIIAALALGALAIDRLTEPRPLARFTALPEPPQGTALPLLRPELFGFLHESDRVFVSYGEFGALDLWRTTDARGRQCLVVSVGGAVPGFDCTVPDIETIVSLRSQNSWVPANPDGGPIPNGSTLRFVLDDGVIEVYVARAASPRSPSDDAG